MDDELAATYEVFGRRWARGTSPLYEEWAVGIAGDAEVLGLIAALPAAKRRPNLVFASARWVGCPLAPYPAWRTWLLAHWSSVAETATQRSVQTNEPNRCATLLAAFSVIDGPLALLEVGAAAGLCLLPDRYGYRYDTEDGPLLLDPAAPGPASSGPAAPGPAAPGLRCSVDGETPALRLPEVAWRRGIDLDPIDPADDDAVRWLQTLVWPGPHHDERAARLAAAAAVAASDPPEVIRGDLLTSLVDVAATSPADATLVVFHSAVLMYLDAADRRRFVALVTGLGRRLGRRVVWVSQETSSVFELPLPAALDADQRFVQAVDGHPSALAGQHGATYRALR